MKRFLLIVLAAALSAPAVRAQLQLPGTWKFKTGDDPAWSSPAFDDAGWQTIKVGQRWESQGHADYDGYAWYRVHFTIPANLREGAFPGAELKISLGRIDDGDVTFLNGKIIGQNGGVVGTLEEGSHNHQRVYLLPTDDPAIHWGGDNTLAVRVYDRSGSGGMTAGPYTVSMTTLSDAVNVDFSGESFRFRGASQLAKTIYLETSLGQQEFRGTFSAVVIDPVTGKEVYARKTPARFSQGKPFPFKLDIKLPEAASYQAVYTYQDGATGKTLSASEGVPYILTPAPSPKPQINGARVTGVRPGHPFLFRIPATGKRPLQYAATGLPQGLRLDSKTGIISGSVAKAGDYAVSLRVSNALDADTRTLTIKVGSLIGLTPAMGWNSWNAWGTSVDDKKVEAAADAMVKQGLVDHGWTYINIDDGWERPERAADGEIVTNDKFPDMKQLADYVHSQGLKLGIYSSPGPQTCGGFTGSYQHEMQDAGTYARWGIDYLKYDWCSYSRIAPPHPDLAWLQKPYKLMDSVLQHINRDIYYSLCQYGRGDVWKWGASVNGNSWRTTGDIRDNWQSMSRIGFNQGKAAPYSAPGHWNDPDMLVVGKVGWGPSLHTTHLTPDEQYTHISLWCLLSAPLLIGCDMSQLDAFTLNLLTNDEVLAVDQDPLGKGAMQVLASDSVLVYAKPLSDGSRAVGVFNTGTSPAGMSVSLQALGISGPAALRDLWRQKDLGLATGTYETAKIPAHGVLLLKVSRASSTAGQ